MGMEDRMGGSNNRISPTLRNALTIRNVEARGEVFAVPLSPERKGQGIDRSICHGNLCQNVAAVTISRSAFPNRLEHLSVLDRFKSLRPKGDHFAVVCYKIIT
jgi:hypothetical protein